MAEFPGLSFLGPKSKNMVVAGGLTTFVFGVYFYTMRVVGATDELQRLLASLKTIHGLRPTPRFHRKYDPHQHRLEMSNGNLLFIFRGAYWTT